VASDTGSVPAAVEKGVAPDADLVGSWTLAAIDGEAVEAVGATPDLRVFEDGKVAGVAGVNRFNAEIQATDGRVLFGPVATTKMAGPPEAMELENTYLARLGAVSSYEVEGDTLRLWAGDNEALTFERTLIEP
jgi:heat shock protein HslJ